MCSFFLVWKRRQVSPTFTVFWQAQGILYTTHFCLSPGYDAKNLHPSIPIDKALEKLLSENENLGQTTTINVTSIMELLKWTFDLIYCEYGGSHFVLDSGPIGVGAMGEIAIIYMEDFQLRAIFSFYLYAWLHTLITILTQLLKLHTKLLHIITLFITFGVRDD